MEMVGSTVFRNTGAFREESDRLPARYVSGGDRSLADHRIHVPGTRHREPQPAGIPRVGADQRPENPTTSRADSRAFDAGRILLRATLARRRGARLHHQKTRPHDILLAIRRGLAGQKYLSPEIAADIAGAIGDDAATKPAIHRLSDRELQVFELVGRGHNSKRIAEAMKVSIKTVETYRERIKAKLGYPNYSAMVESAIHWFNGAK